MNSEFFLNTILHYFNPIQFLILSTGKTIPTWFKKQILTLPRRCEKWQGGLVADAMLPCCCEMWLELIHNLKSVKLGLWLL